MKKNVMGKQVHTVKIETVLLVGALLNIIITWSYSSSLLPVYAGVSIIIAIFAYGNFFLKLSQIDGVYGLICIFLLFESFFTGVLMRSGLKSMIMVNMSLFLPVGISTLKIDITNAKKGACIISLLSFALMFLHVETGILGHINSNTISFLAYILLSTGFIWYEYSKAKIVPIFYFASCMMIFLRTGSRNAAITIVICFFLLALPKAIVKRKCIFRVIYGLALIYSFFALKVMEWGFNQPRISHYLNAFTSAFSEKAWGMEGRVYFFQKIAQKLDSLDFLTQLFGEGVCQHLGHNLYYQCVYMWGIVGTILIYLLLIYIFEIAYKEIIRGNLLVYGCFIILVGHIILNGADVYLFGAETCQPLPMIILGIVLHQHRYRRDKEREEMYCNE